MTVLVTGLFPLVETFDLEPSLSSTCKLVYRMIIADQISRNWRKQSTKDILQGTCFITNAKIVKNLFNLCHEIFIHGMYPWSSAAVFDLNVTQDFSQVALATP